MRMRIGIKPAIFIAIVLVACLAAACQTSEKPTILTSTASISQSNSLIANVDISLESESAVFVEYWPANGVSDEIVLRTPRTAPGTTHKIQLIRLKPSTTYQFQPSTVDKNNKIKAGPVGTFTTGTLPEPIASLSFDNKGKFSSDLVLLDVRDQNADYFVAIDSDANVVWYYLLEEPGRGIIQKENHNFIFCEDDFIGLKEITPAGGVVHSLQSTPATGDCHHAMTATPDGNSIAYLSYDLRTIADPKFGEQTRVVGDTIRLWDQVAGTTKEVWNAFDFISTDKRIVWAMGGGGSWSGFDNKPAVDWTHGNSITIGPRGNYIVSLRHLNQILSIDKTFTKIEWRLGGPDSDYSFPNPSDRFYHQHSAYELPNGNILLFDNGNTRPKEEGGEYSRALELSLDEYDSRATKVWDYSYNKTFSASKGNVNRLPNGNTLIAFIGRSGQPQTTVEADKSGKPIWENTFTSPKTLDRYRANPIDSLSGEEIIGVRGPNERGPDYK